MWNKESVYAYNLDKDANVKEKKPFQDIFQNGVIVRILVSL